MPVESSTVECAWGPFWRLGSTLEPTCWMSSLAFSSVPSAATGNAHTLPLMKLATNARRPSPDRMTWQGSVPPVGRRLRNVSAPVGGSTEKELRVPVGSFSNVFSSLTA